MESKETREDPNAQFLKDCQGKTKCDLHFTLWRSFDKKCAAEFDTRWQNTELGPNHIYGLATCVAGEEITSTKLGSMSLTRSDAAILIVCLDGLIMLILSISVIRLRWYEQASLIDLRSTNTSTSDKARSKIEDFTVKIPEIPFDKKTYANSPEVLKAQLAVHLEAVIQSED